jgi:hypothetical protein
MLYKCKFAQLPQAPVSTNPFTKGFILGGGTNQELQKNIHA